MKKFKTILIFSLILNIIAIAFGARRVYYMYEENTVTKNQSSPFSRQSIYDLFPIDSTDIVFIGDSHTQRFDTQEFFNNPNIKNRGFDGDVTTDLLKRLPKIVVGHPKKMFIEIGFNDLRTKPPVDSVVKNITSIVTYIKTHSPSTKIYLNNIFPSAITYTYINKYSAAVNNALSKQLGITLINIHDALVNNGRLNPKYDCGDGVHLNGQGYLVWANILKPYLL